MSRIFLLNLFLAVVYVVLTGNPSGMNFLIGFALGYVIMTLYCRALGMPSYGGKLVRLARFGLYFAGILTRANLQVAWEVITPGFGMTPRIIRYPVHDMNDVQTTVLANAISLTPGTLTTDVSEDGNMLYIHCMYSREREQAVREIDELKHRIMREVFG